MSLLRKLAVIAALAVTGVYVYLALRGPQGIPVLLAKWQEIRELQKQNAELAKAVKQRQDRLRLIKESQSEQELLVRKLTKRLGKGDTTYLLPKDGKEPASTEPAAAPESTPPPAKPADKPRRPHSRSDSHTETRASLEGVTPLEMAPAAVVVEPRPLEPPPEQ